MLCNNPKLDLVNMKAYMKFGEILPIGSQDIEPKQNVGINKGNPKLNLVNVNAYIKFGENMSSSSQDIEGKRKFDVNQGP